MSGTSTTFTNGVTLTDAGWFNDVNTVAYTLFGNGTTYTGALTLGSSGNIAVNTNKFTVTASNGNTLVAGTLAVTGVATLTAQPILSSLTASQAVFTDGSKGLVSNAITGTGNVVMSASPTLTGTITAAAITASGAVATGNLSVTGTGYFSGKFTQGVSVYTNAPASSVGIYNEGSFAYAAAFQTTAGASSYALGVLNDATSGTVKLLHFLTGATGGTPRGSIGYDVTNSRMDVAGDWFYNGFITSTAAVTALSATAIPAGGTAGSGYKFSSTSNFGVFFGSGAPTLSAAKGSLYLRSDGSTTNNRAYINTDGSTTWTALTTAA